MKKVGVQQSCLLVLSQHNTWQLRCSLIGTGVDKVNKRNDGANSPVSGNREDDSSEDEESKARRERWREFRS